MLFQRLLKKDPLLQQVLQLLKKDVPLVIQEIADRAVAVHHLVDSHEEALLPHPGCLPNMEVHPLEPQRLMDSQEEVLEEMVVPHLAAYHHKKALGKRPANHQEEG